MARIFLMTWIEVKKRWNKHYKGKMYCVTTKALGMPPTPLDSFQAANAWWLAKQAEIDAANLAAQFHRSESALQAQNSFASSEEAQNAFGGGQH